MTFSLHSLLKADFDEADEVIKAAYNINGSRKETLRQYTVLQPDGVCVVRENETIVGFGAALDYGTFAYIGLMSVHPSVQKRGVGRLLMDTLLQWLEKRGCATILLDASHAGAPLYFHYGFVEDDKTLHMRQVQNVVASGTHFGRVTRLNEGELAKLVAFDAPHFGASRGALLHLLAAHDPKRVFVNYDSRGDIRGYLVAQASTIGPWVARSIEDAEGLLQSALTLSYTAEPTVFVSEQHTDALALLARHGFEQTRFLTHMRLGKSVERGRATTLYGQASLGFG